MNALSFCPRSPRRQAPRALRERLECSEGGDTGRRTRGSYRVWRLSQTWPSVQPPAGVERNGAVYARPASKGKAIEAKRSIETRLLRISGRVWSAPGSVRRAALPVRRLRG